MRQRPQNFTIDRRNKLAKGLVFAGLGGQSAKTLRYTDSSSFRNHGTLTNMDPATDWVWSSELGRWVLDFDGINDNVAFPNYFAGDLTQSVWIYNLRTTAVIGPIFGHLWGYNTRYGISIFGENLYYRPNSSVSVNNVLLQYTWAHVAVTQIANIAMLYVNGRYASTLNSTPLTGTAAWRFGASLGGETYVNAQLGDPLIYNRALSPAEIQILANRSDPMLGGLIQNPRRKFYPVGAPIVERRKYLILRKGNKALVLQK